MRCTLPLFVVWSMVPLCAQQRVLHFTATSGFDHDTRTVSLALFNSIAEELGVVVDDDNDGHSFSSATTLALYDVIVFANTSGNAILDATQRTNFGTYIDDGGSMMGIHAATDTYRHSTANGSNTGTWDRYAELMGASVREAPNHVDGTPLYAMEHIGTHASTAHLPDPWAKNEEYYYWTGGYYNPANMEVLRVEETTGPNGLVNDYDAPRPMSWYRYLPEGGRVFCTALGHAASNYTDDPLFRQHIQDALGWLLEGTTSMAESVTGPRSVWPNPASSLIHVPSATVIEITDATGRVVLRHLGTGTVATIDISPMAPGTYLVRWGTSVTALIVHR